MRGLEPRIRVAIHAGEIHTTGGDVLGTTVDIAARILALASPGEVLMSSTVRDLAADGELKLVHRGEYRFQGAPGRWSLLAIADRAG